LWTGAGGPRIVVGVGVIIVAVGRRLRQVCLGRRCNGAFLRRVGDDAALEVDALGGRRVNLIGSATAKTIAK
jgi:hypothetical protein